MDKQKKKKVKVERQPNTNRTVAQPPHTCRTQEETLTHNEINGPDLPISPR